MVPARRLVDIVVDLMKIFPATRQRGCFAGYSGLFHKEVGMADISCT